MLNMAINIDQLIEYVISIELNIQFQFGVFLRGHFGTPIDPAPVLLSGKPCSASLSGGNQVDGLPPAPVSCLNLIRIKYSIS